MKIANRCFENVAQFRYFGTTIKNKNLRRKGRLNLANAAYHSVQNLSSRLLSKNIKIRIYEIIILPTVLYGCATWSLTLRYKHILRMFENRVLRRILGLKRDKVRGDWGTLHKLR
jgi:hypothetical protein